MVEQTPAEIERLLDAGTELKAGQVATILGLSIATVHRKRAAGDFKVRQQGGDGQYLFDAADIKSRLTKSREVVGGE